MAPFNDGYSSFSRWPVTRPNLLLLFLRIFIYLISLLRFLFLPRFIYFSFLRLPFNNHNSNQTTDGAVVVDGGMRLQISMPSISDVLSQSSILTDLREKDEFLAGTVQELTSCCCCCSFVWIRIAVHKIKYIKKDRKKKIRKARLSCHQLVLVELPWYYSFPTAKMYVSINIYAVRSGFRVSTICNNVQVVEWNLLRGLKRKAKEWTSERMREKEEDPQPPSGSQWRMDLETGHHL